MDQQKQELVEKLKGANNVLVTVSSNPSVDQLAVCIGLTIFLNKLGKHATAVFSGNVPSTLDFLKPEETLEKNTDSLRDFIIALDKAKADKLRYKVEENVVKIFITPYKTSITEGDLDFSQGDFNVDVVLCLGVQQQQDLDQAITAHGRILHDAVVTSINTTGVTELASVNWANTNASSLSEMGVELVDALGKDLMDGQIATALLTGIVAETDRFSNEKTSPETMRLSAELMTAGANQQLVATELQAPLQTGTAEVHDEGAPDSGGNESAAGQDGTLEINHPGDDAPDEDTGSEPPAFGNGPDEQPPAGPGAFEMPSDGPELNQPASRMILQPPSTGGTLTANTVPDTAYGSAVDPLTMVSSDALVPPAEPSILNHEQGTSIVPPGDNDAGNEAVSAPPAPEETPDTPSSTESEPLVLPEVASTEDTTDEVHEEPSELVLPPAPESAPEPPVVVPPAPEPQIQIDPNGNFQLPTQPAPSPEPSPAPQVASTGGETLADLEKAVHSEAPATEPAAPALDVDKAREEVLNELNSMPLTQLEPQASVGATGYLDVNHLDDMADPTPPTAPAVPDPAAPPAEPPVLLDEAPSAVPSDQSTLPMPPSLNVPVADPTPPTSTTTDPTAPPPVPPPIITDPTQFLNNPDKAA